MRISGTRDANPEHSPADPGSGIPETAHTARCYLYSRAIDPEVRDEESS